MLIKFKIWGNLRFLSHAETLKVFERALVRQAHQEPQRAGEQMVYSQGYNPRPKISLPLPRPVGVETDDDMLSLYINASPNGFNCAQFANILAEQMPKGFEIISVRQTDKKSSAAAVEADYFFALKKNIICDEQSRQQLRNSIEKLLAMDSIFVQRKIFKGKRGLDGAKIKQVDVRRYLRDIELGEKGILVSCIVSSEGAARIDELMELLKLNKEDLEGPIRRTKVEWKY